MSNDVTNKLFVADLIWQVIRYRIYEGINRDLSWDVRTAIVIRERETQVKIHSNPKCATPLVTFFYHQSRRQTKRAMSSITL